MGYCDLTCYGNKYIETPNIDKLAATGTSFTQCYAGSGISSPSRCALMTGGIQETLPFVIISVMQEVLKG